MSERESLENSIKCLETAKEWMVEAFNFDQVNTGYGNDLYGESIDRLISGIVEYLHRQ
jgi:hypothetical protein